MRIWIALIYGVPILTLFVRLMPMSYSYRRLYPINRALGHFEYLVGPWRDRLLLPIFGILAAYDFLYGLFTSYGFWTLFGLPCVGEKIGACGNLSSPGSIPACIPAIFLITGTACSDLGPSAQMWGRPLPYRPQGPSLQRLRGTIARSCPIPELRPISGIRPCSPT